LIGGFDVNFFNQSICRKKKNISGNALQVCLLKKCTFFSSCKPHDKKKHIQNRPANRMTKKYTFGAALQV
jgi:hypothetical protein